MTKIAKKKARFEDSPSPVYFPPAGNTRFVFCERVLLPILTGASFARGFATAKRHRPVLDTRQGPECPDTSA